MGFFSSISGGLFGTPSKGTSSSVSGLGALPDYAQGAYKDLISNAQSLLNGQAGVNAYTPLAKTQQETQAFNLMQLPTTAEGVQSLVGNFLNPFTSYITDNINKEYGGKYSAYKSALANSGQMGSNREFLNATANDEARANAIGSALANEYNTAQSTALNQNQNSIANLLTQGSFERGIDTDTKQAGINALSQLGTFLGMLPASSNSNSFQKGSTEGALGSIIKLAGLL